ncbi:MAG: HDIG domain-containing protein [Candidatus Peregrinibacteria bacterium]|nr:HDIG domain-containing protein [Candidatus Peregrinibacteria bacterium]MDZ4245473.1 HDIG domain-containing protein [Candidatus Gracilibacteria bacterium]
MIPYILGAIIALISFLLVSSSKLEDKLLAHAQVKAEQLIADNKQRAKEGIEKRERIAKEDKGRIKKQNEEFEKQLEKQEEMITEKEELVKKRDTRVAQLEGTIKNLDKDVKNVTIATEEVEKKVSDEAAKKAGTTKDATLKTILEKHEHDFANWKDDQLRIMDAPDYKDDVVPLAKSILTASLQRYTAQSSVDTKEFSFELKNDSMKGPLVGQGGKTINYFEEKAECVVIFNYEPNLVIVSCLNMYKRAIAKEALQILSHKKTVDNKTIDLALAEAKKKIDRVVMDFGKRAAKMLGYKDLPEELIFLIGKFEFRTSFGQNIWWHSMEVAFFARMIAEAINANVQRALDAAFYHDLGKAIDHDLDEAIGHDHLSKDLMEKFNMDPLTIHAAYAHHDAVPCIRPEDFIVKAADAMSAARPGARQQTIERYLQLVRELTDRASSCEGVKKAFTVNAGREVRAYVDERNVDDTMTEGIAQKIAHDIEENMGYPGTIKINVIRATEAYETAKEKMPAKRY